MQKNIEFTIQVNTADGIDLLGRYGDYVSEITSVLAAASVITRHFMLDPRFGGGKTATIISNVVVDSGRDFVENFEAFREAVAEGFGVGALDVSVLTAEESELP